MSSYCRLEQVILFLGQRDSDDDVTLDNMSDLALRQVQKKLEKEKTELEWKLKEYGWRLDQASAVRNASRKQ